MNHKKLIILASILILLAISSALFAMAGNMEQKKNAQPAQDWPLVSVPGKIIFQSNRDGSLSEIWMLENGELKKVISGEKTSKDVPKELPSPFNAMLGGVFADLNNAKWSPNPESFLCTGDGKLVVFDPQGQVIKNMTPSKYPYRATWSPDGKEVYYVAVDELPEGGGSQNIYRIRLLDGLEQRITSFSPMPGIRRVLLFAISPDNQTIAFQMMGEKEHGISIWTIRTDGSDLKLLVKYAGDPAWSRDGTKLAYISTHSPEGKEINRFNEIFILDLTSGNTTQVTHNEWDDRHPVFSPDGTKIAFKSARHKMINYGAELFVINTDGTGEARLTPPQPNPKYPNDPIRGWADPSPDLRPLSL